MIGTRKILTALYLALLLVTQVSADVREVRLGVKGAT